MGPQDDDAATYGSSAIGGRVASDRASSRRTRTVGRLRAFIHLVMADSMFRRLLESDPQKALARFDYYHSSTPERLAPPDRVNVYTDETSVLGIPGETASDSVPLDMRLVAYGAKPLALLFGPAEQLREYAAWAESRSLVTLLSPFEYEPIPPMLVGEMEQRPIKGPDGFRGLIVSANESDAELGWLSMLFGWNTFLTRLLAIPECCFRRQRNWRWTCLDDYVLALDSRRLPKSGSFEWYYNAFGRFFGHGLLCHLPCSFECKESAASALWNLNCLRIHEPEYAETLSSALTTVFVVAGDCVMSFPGATVSPVGDGGREIAYQQILCTAPASSLARAIQGSSSSLVWQGDELKIGESRFFGCSIWLFTRTSGGKDESTSARIWDSSEKRRQEPRGFFARAE